MSGIKRPADQDGADPSSGSKKPRPNWFDKTKAGSTTNLPQATSSTANPEVTIRELPKGRCLNRPLTARVVTTPQLYGRDTVLSLKFMLTDKSGSLPAIAWTTEAEKFVKLIRGGKAYTFKNFEVSWIDPKYRKGDNEYQLKLLKDTEVVKIRDEESVVELDYNFLDCEKIDESADGAIVDFFGILVQDSEKDTENKESVMRRTLTLVDGIGTEMELCLWRGFGSEDTFEVGKVVAFKNVAIKSFLGSRTLNSFGDTLILADFRSPEAEQMLQMFVELEAARNEETEQERSDDAMGSEEENE